MTVVNPDSIAGITSVTSSGTTLEFYDVNGNLLDVSANLTGQLTVGTGATINSPATNAIDFETNGAERLRITSTGRVGIGTDTPADDPLTLYDADNNVGMYFQSPATGNANNNGFRIGRNQTHAFVWNYVNQPLAFATQGVERLTILGNGKIGINTDNPQKELEVRGTILKTRTDSGIGLIYLTNDASQNGNILINQNGGVTKVKLDSVGDSYFNGGSLAVGSTSSSGWKFRVQVPANASYQSGLNVTNNTNADLQIDIKNSESRFGPSTNTPLVFKTNNTEKVRINSSGDVCIGGSASDIGNKLNVVESSGNAAILLAASTVSASGFADFTFAPSNTVAGARIRVQAEEDFSSTANRTANMQFYTRKDGTLAERLRITSDGNVKIGDATTDFTYKLTVSGNASVNTGLFMYDGAAGTWFGIQTQAADGLVVLRADARSGGYPPLTFNVGGTERLRITNSGEVKIGNWNSSPIVTFQAGTSSNTNRVNFYDNNATEGCYIKTEGQASGAKLHIGRRWDDDGEQVTFDLRKSEGHVRMGLGTQTPEGIFHINNSGNGTSDGFHYITGNNGTGAKLFLGTTDNSDRSKYIQHSSYWTEIGCHNNEGVRFRESDGDIRFYMNGSTGNYNFTGSNVSDRNLKENIETITTSSIDLIKQVIPRTFNWKHDRKNIPHGGFIAQEMQPLFPKLINGVEYDESRTDNGDPNDENAGKCNPTGMGFDYNGYTAYLTKAMQELIAKVETLEAKVAANEAGDTTYNAKIDKIIDYFKL